MNEHDAFTLAIAVTGSEAGAQAFMDRPNSLLGGHTPRQVAHAGDARRVVGMLLDAADL